jgi:Flp pilus assembly protein TadG
VLRSERGSVTVEFIIIVPLMLFVLSGFVEIYAYVRAVSVLEHTAFALADSIGQMQQVVNDNTTSSSNNLGSIWNAATLLAAPNTLSSRGGVIITSVCDSKTSPCGTPPSTASMTAGTPSILWQKSAPWTLSNFASQVTKTSVLPSTWPFRVGDSAIVVEVFYQYTPFSMTAAFWRNAPGTQTLYQRVYVRSRSGQTLQLVAAS